ncbi:MAG: ribosome-associated translation inhibitor RaiA [Candidatus Omnitrophica bacterium]|nr:ribosome-associated translation inhibitor RaiA [Candidatus Omnitrophota bacterium]
MKVSITGKHIQVRSGMKSYINERLEKLKHFFSGVDAAHIVLKTEKYLNTAEVSLKGKKLHLFAEGSSEENLYIAIDRAVDRIESQIKRQTEKIKGHDAKRVAKRKEAVLGGGFPGVLIERELVGSKPMTLEEARLQLDVEDQDFLVFENAASRRLSVLYKKKKGSYGLIES